MIATELEIRQADSDDLDASNQIITAAVMNWDLSERVKRLSLPSYLYKEIDLQFFQIYLASSQNKPVAVLTLENELVNINNNSNALLIHGLYVHPHQQTGGIGSQLINVAEQQARLKNANGLLVKAQKDAEGFFIRMGMQKLTIENESRDYAGRYWKAIS